MSKPSKKPLSAGADRHYANLVTDLSQLLESARLTSVHAVNAIMTATYWEFGRRIVEFEQHGKARAVYGEALLKSLSRDLTGRLGRGFSADNLESMRRFYTAYPPAKISETLSRKLMLPPVIEGISETPSRILDVSQVAESFPLPWSHYVRLMTVKNKEAREFYETEALRGGWTVRQLDRQISTSFFERTALSHDKVAMLTKGAKARPEDHVSANEQVRDSLMLEFLNLKDEYSESDLEEALLQHLEHFLLELGNDFTFLGRQRRLRIGGEWLRVDLVFFHRRLRCLMVIDLKIGKFTHADAGQMHTYLNYAREHWMLEGENPPVGLILCSERDDALARYALEGLPNKVLTREYRLVLPDEKQLVAEIERTRQIIEARAAAKEPPMLDKQD